MTGLSERPVQRGAIDLLKLIDIRAVHVPNGAHLAGGKLARAKQMAALKADGLDTGFPDLILFDRRVRCRVGLIEVKREKGGEGLSPEQAEWRDFLAELGFPWAMIRLPAQALDAVREWGWR